MLPRALSPSRPSFLAAVVLLMLIVLAGLPGEATAQERKPIHYISVTGSSADNTCFYQIEDQENQDLLRITPRGALIFTSSADFPIETTIEPDAEGNAGVAGGQGMNTFTTREQSVTPVAVRAAMGKNTDHKVRIQCCTDKGLFGGCRWTPAEPISSESGQMGYAPQTMPPHTMQTAPAPHGPSAPSLLPDVLLRDLTPHSPTRTGGPVMKIEE